MDKVVHFFENLPDKQKEHLIESPTIRDAFSADLADDFDLSIEEIKTILDTLIKGKETLETHSHPPLKFQKKKVSWDKGESFKIKEKKAQLMNKFLELLQSNNGLSKTYMLKSIKKDNPLWRKLATDVLEYMVGRDLILKISNKYYLTNSLLQQENTFHRRVYDYICKGPKTISNLLLHLNYRNPKGKVKLMAVLSLMEDEGMIYREGNKWVLRNNNL